MELFDSINTRADRILDNFVIEPLTKESLYIQGLRNKIKEEMIGLATEITIKHSNMIKKTLYE